MNHTVDVYREIFKWCVNAEVFVLSSYSFYYLDYFFGNLFRRAREV